MTPTIWKRLRSWEKTVIISIVTLLILVVGGFWFSLTYGELADKATAAFLQKILVTQTEKPVHGRPTILRNPFNSQYTVMGILNNDPLDHDGVAWIILNQSRLNHSIYIIPHDAKVRLSCSYIQSLTAEKIAHTDVLKFLQSNCLPG